MVDGLLVVRSDEDLGAPARGVLVVRQDRVDGGVEVRLRVVYNIIHVYLNTWMRIVYEI